MSDGYYSDEADGICYVGRHTIDLEEASSSSECEVSALESSSSMDSDVAATLCL